jgi:protein-ribulosamine 3-kinase
MHLTKQFIQQLETETGYSLSPHRLSSVSGGDINHAYHLQTASVSWFIKLNQPHTLPMFVAEAAGLKELAKTQTVRIPNVIACDKTADYAYLILEYIKLKSQNSASERLFAQQLARLHQQKQPFYGWAIENTIGSTAQHNGSYDNWIDFWQQQRLSKQLQLAAKNGYGGHLQNSGEKLCAEVGGFFRSYTPAPALLHGDLWGGNVAADAQDNPVMFDPACYYGDREADIAMTELFGGFGSEFYAVYREQYPLDSGYKTRKNLYNLYHILNHLNLFGRSYLHRAEAMIAALLAEL